MFPIFVMRTQLVLIFWKKNGGRSEKIYIPLALRAWNDSCLKWINHFLKTRVASWKAGSSVASCESYKINEFWRKPMARTNWTRSCDVPLGISNKKDGKPNSRLVFGCLILTTSGVAFDFFYPPWLLLQKRKLLISTSCPYLNFSPFWSTITAVCNCIMFTE